MKIGIVIPYYENGIEMKKRFKNLLKTLEETIDDNFEIVIVDDGSNSLWLNDYLKFKVIHLQENSGVSHARNVGIDYLIVQKVDYIGFIDADDSISNDFLKETYKYAKEGYDYIDCRFIQDGIEVFGTKENYERQIKCIRNGVVGCFYKTITIGEHRFDENLQIGEDGKFVNEVVDLSKHTKGISKGMYVYNKGVNENSLTMRYIRKEIGEIFKNNNIDKLD